MASSPNSRRWPGLSLAWIVLGSTGLIALLLTSVCFFLGNSAVEKRLFLRTYRAPNDYESHASFSMNYALHSSAVNDVVFLGDSTCLTGVIPQQFTRLTGCTAYNLGSVGILGIDGYGLTLKAYLEHHPRPRLIVFCVPPDALYLPLIAQGPTAIHDRFVQIYGGPLGASDMPFAEVVRQGAELMTANWFGGLARAAELPIPRRHGQTFNSLEKQVAGDRGYWEHPSVLPADFVRPTDPSFRLFLAAHRRKFLDAIAELAAAHQTPLLIRLSPMVTPSSTEDSSQLSADLQEFAEAHPGVMISSPVILIYPPRFFGELHHLDRAGAMEFTNLLAREARELESKGALRAAPESH